MIEHFLLGTTKRGEENQALKQSVGQEDRSKKEVPSSSQNANSQEQLYNKKIGDPY